VPFYSKRTKPLTFEIFFQAGRGGEMGAEGGLVWSSSMGEGHRGGVGGGQGDTVWGGDDREVAGEGKRVQDSEDGQREGGRERDGGMSPLSGTHSQK
jgi:hypothetical protein